MLVKYLVELDMGPLFFYSLTMCLFLFVKGLAGLLLYKTVKLYRSNNLSLKAD